MALHDQWTAEQQRWDLRFGVLCSTTANFSMGKDPDKPALRPHDFFPLPEPEPEEMSEEQMFAVLEAFAGGVSN